jgi:lipopolysaccharide export system protein LptA
MRRRQSARVSVCLAAVLLAAPLALAQTSTVVPNPMQGFSTNRDKPIRIKAQSFELRDKDHKATFVGNVQVVQGDTVIRCRSLIVTYLPDAQPGTSAPAAATPGPGANTKISKLDALGGVIVTQNDQTATGDSGVFDVQANTVTLMGNVVVSQNGNVMRGEQLVVDLTTGVSRVLSGSRRGPVEMLIPQSPSNAQKPGSPPTPKLDSLRPAQRN